MIKLFNNKSDASVVAPVVRGGAGRANGKLMAGVVVSDKMKDTIVVSVERYVKHPRYSKFIKRRKKYKVHDLGNTTKIGDKVQIIETKPISKDKHFMLVGQSDKNLLK